MTTTALNLEEIAAFWRQARRLHVIYAELDRVFEIGVPPCSELENPSDRSEPESLQNVRNWFEQMDAHIQVWQFRQLLQSTNLQTEESLRDLILRHLHKKERTEMDRDKVDFLLVQYFAHCAPHGPYEPKITLDEVARILAPVVGGAEGGYPPWAAELDARLEQLNNCNSLEQMQDAGSLVEVRETKTAIGDQYFGVASMIAFTRFNFLARRAFFRAMHLDLHAIRSSVNELEAAGKMTVDCSAAGLSDRESLEHILHIIHQWKTPFRAPYSGGSSFLQLIQLRHVLEHAVGEKEKGQGTETAHDKTAADTPKSGPQDGKPVIREVPVPVVPRVAAVPDFPVEAPQQPSHPPAGKVIAAAQVVAPEPSAHAELQNCIDHLTGQLKMTPPKTTPSASSIVMGGCRLMIATWEAAAFISGQDQAAQALRGVVAARTILQVAIERKKKLEPADLPLALEIAREQVQQMQAHIAEAKEAKNVDAAVNLAATTKRLQTLVDEAEKLRA